MQKRFCSEDRDFIDKVGASTLLKLPAPLLKAEELKITAKSSVEGRGMER